jgi:hypothetical protein
MASHHILGQRRYRANHQGSPNSQRGRRKEEVLEMMSDHPGVSYVLNWASAVSIMGTLVGWLPEIAAGLGGIWYCVLLYEYIKKSWSSK